MKLFCRTRLAVVLLAALFVAACGSCESCSEEVDEEPDPVVEEPDAAEEDEGDELAEATADAEEQADSRAFNIEQNARFLASELEGLSSEAEDPNTKNVATKRAPRARDEGEIDVEQVQRVFSKHRSDLQICYERALKRDPLLQGKVVLTLRVGASGEPTMVNAQSNAMPDEAALNCMEREAKNWLFPRPKGGTVLLNKPFRFTPEN
jgi:hypothetical protein